jgi:hypothetical protein
MVKYKSQSLDKTQNAKQAEREAANAPEIAHVIEFDDEIVSSVLLAN